MVLSLSNEDIMEPLGLKNEVSNDVSGPSGSARDPTDGDARKMEDSYDSLVSDRTDGAERG